MKLLMILKNTFLFSPKRRFKNLPYYIAAFFMPNIFLFDLYNRNRAANHIVFEHVLILAGILATIGVFVFLVFKLAAKSAEGALLLTFLFWVCFWLFEALHGLAILRNLVTSTQLIVILIVVLALIAVVFRRYEPPFTKVRPAFIALSLSLVVLFAFNLVPSVHHEITLQRARTEITDGENAPFYIKRDFHIDEALPNPDILWIHLDGMMSMETVEWFFGINQDHLREELALRGFVMNPNAKLNGGGTRWALPALLSPAYYDSFWGERLRAAENTFTDVRAIFLDEELTLVGLDYHSDVESSFELVTAFDQRGYSFTEISDMYRMLQLPSDHRYIAQQRFLNEVGDLLELLNLTTPLNINPSTEHPVIDAQNTNSDYEPFAQFTFFALMYTHVLWMNNFQFDPEPECFADFSAYPGAYEHITNRMLYTIDMFLSENPDTVIVLQADHGFHSEHIQRHLLDLGYSLEQVMELTYSVFSAVRIPNRYGGLDEPISVKNISRELVNRFVGQNYDLLP